MAVHDTIQFAGPGAEIAVVVDEELYYVLEAPVLRVGARFVPNPGRAALEVQLHANVNRIAAVVRRSLEKSTVEVGGDV